MRTFAILSTIAGASAMKSANAALESYTFEMFESEFSKTYSSPVEREIRKAAFFRNLEEMRTMNDQQPRATFGVNKFADWMPEDEAVFMGRMHKGEDDVTFAADASDFEVTDEEYASLPASQDWSEYFTPVRSQGQCGSCWAFAATGVLEAYNSIVNGEDTVLSTQQLVDCVANPNKCGGTGGCHGATEQLAFEYVQANGIVAESKYPYLAKEETCKVMKKTDEAMTISAWKHLPANNGRALKRHLAKVGPVTAAVAAAPMKFYTGGVMECPKGLDKQGNPINVVINHAVIITGYGSDEQGQYYVIRNSWGAAWGEEGHIRVRINNKKDEHYCNTDFTPQAGSACEGEVDPIEVCGNCGMDFETAFVSVVPKADAVERM